jgi:tRNA A37 threonylcarbamoyladenosine modification protein TsaB
MQLFINTSTNDEVIIALMEGGSVVLEKRFSARYRQAELLLVEIDSLLAEKKVKLEKIDKIIVENRGESFTALRIGVVTANALGYALSIPVVEKQVIDKKIAQKHAEDYDIVKPEYNREPNITMKKSGL